MLEETPESAEAVGAESTDVPEEPILEIDEIQGNVLVGFNKPYQCFLFLRITDAQVFRGWLAGVVDHVSSMREVLAFNRLWKAMRKRRGGARPALEVAWFNLGFTAAGLSTLDVSVKHFADKAFKEGLHRRSSILGDPTTGQGSPAEWLVGGPGREPDVILLFAADSEQALLAERRRLAGGWEARGDILQGAELLHVDTGQALPEGREHFGFVDGISQPGVRGRLSDNPTDFLTPRRNPHDPDQGLPGQDLIWPGEFVFGYESQKPTGPTSTPGPSSQVGPTIQSADMTWERNGSFLVFRRLRQDVEGMTRFLDKTAEELDVDPELLAAKLIGRWRSGAPVLLAQEADDPLLARDSTRNNDFRFADLDNQSSADLEGLVCPLESHIRKVNPRDDSLRFDPPTTRRAARTHRILRRGISFWSSEPNDRGLLFLSYQTSIENQFEFIQTKWANPRELMKPTSGSDFSAGSDPVIGRESEADQGRRPFRIHFPDRSETEILELPSWVWPQGGGYFFCPSASGLRVILRSRRGIGIASNL